MAEAAAILAAPIIEGGKSLEQVTRDVCAPMERRAGPLWWVAFAGSFSLLLLGVVAVTYQIATGVGTWGQIGRAHV